MLGLDLSSDTLVRCPAAEKQPVGVMPHTFIPGLNNVNSWFNFWMLPAISVLSPVPGESKDGLEKALKIVEGEIEELIELGVPSRNIVVGGRSQGGCLTLYTAMHTKYKLGGFVPIVTWVPLLQSEPPESLPEPVNKDTPILQLNGEADLIVPLVPAGEMTKKAMEKVNIFIFYLL